VIYRLDHEAATEGWVDQVYRACPDTESWKARRREGPDLRPWGRCEDLDRKERDGGRCAYPVTGETSPSPSVKWSTNTSSRAAARRARPRPKSLAQVFGPSPWRGEELRHRWSWLRRSSVFRHRRLGDRVWHRRAIAQPAPTGV